MTVKQISILLENKPGMLSEVSELLGKEGINIGAMSLSESTERTIVRIITNNPQKTLQVMKNTGRHCWETDVVAIVTPDHPGGLSAVLKPLATGGVNVHYLYAYLRRYQDNAVIIFRMDDTNKALEVLKKNYVQVLGEELYAL